MLGPRIKSLREKAGWSQKALAHAAGVSQQLITKLESGKARESRKIGLLARAFGITVEELLHGAGGPKPPKDRPPTAAAAPGAGWPFHFPRARFDRLSQPQQLKIELAVEGLLDRYEADNAADQTAAPSRRAAGRS